MAETDGLIRIMGDVLIYEILEKHLQGEEFQVMPSAKGNFVLFCVCVCVFVYNYQGLLSVKFYTVLFTNFS